MQQTKTLREPIPLTEQGQTRDRALQAEKLKQEDGAQRPSRPTVTELKWRMTQSWRGVAEVGVKVTWLCHLDIHPLFSRGRLLRIRSILTYFCLQSKNKNSKTSPLWLTSSGTACSTWQTSPAWFLWHRACNLWCMQLRETQCVWHRHLHAEKASNKENTKTFLRKQHKKNKGIHRKEYLCYP